MLDHDSERHLDRRTSRGERLLCAAWETGVSVEGEDRESAFADGVSDMLTTILGRAGGHRERPDEPGLWEVFHDEARLDEARGLLDRALRSYEGDAEDYHEEG